MVPPRSRLLCCSGVSDAPRAAARSTAAAAASILSPTNCTPRTLFLSISAFTSVGVSGTFRMFIVNIAWIATSVSGSFDSAR